MTGAELAAIRKAAGLSQTDLAQRAGVGRDAVSYWECKPRVDRRSWAVVQIGKVLSLPDEPALYHRRTGWAARLLAAERLALDAACIRVADAETQRSARRRVPCRAKTRKGRECRCLSEPGKRRCKFHGGLSTGAKTPEGRERIAEAQRRRWARWRAARDERRA